MTRALFIGRFQPFHNAHLLDVKKILKEVDEIIIAVGSSHAKNTLENPFSYNERKKMVELVLRKNKIKKYEIYPVPDLYDDVKWVNYVQKNLPKYDFVYSGNLWTLKCFKRHGLSAKKIKLIKGISSTIIRNMMVKGKNWKKLVPKEVFVYIKRINGVGRIKKVYAKK